MKNILAENMIRFGTKNLSESAKLILTEQNEAYWDDLLKGKQFVQDIIELPAVPLMEPTTGKQVMSFNINTPNESKRPVFVGIQATADFAKNKKPGDGRFRGRIYIYLTFNANAKISAYDTTNTFITVLQTLTADKKIASVVGEGQQMASYDKNGFQFEFGRQGSSGMLRSYMRKNLSGYIGKDMLDKLNAKLIEWGMPEVPNDIAQPSF